MRTLYPLIIQARGLKMLIKLGQTILLCALLASCSGLEDSEREKIRKMNATGEHIYRSHDEVLFAIKKPAHYVRANYPWEDSYVGNNIRITKEFFRCKGSSHNPPITKQTNGQAAYIIDCGGMQQHSLPLKDGKEYIYPALFDLLNYVQEKTLKKVVITCGYRCPTHNTYADASHYNESSKHMIGAEVDFYVKGLEWSPETVVNIVKQYYKTQPKFKDQSRFTEFERFENETNVSTLPWYNKEIFIKLFKKDEGRDLDNSHRFPYISIHLRWDRDQEESINYTWSKAFNNYLRY